LSSAVHVSVIARDNLLGPLCRCGTLNNFVGIHADAAAILVSRLSGTVSGRRGVDLGFGDGGSFLAGVAAAKEVRRQAVAGMHRRHVFSRAGVRETAATTDCVPAKPCCWCGLRVARELYSCANCLMSPNCSYPWTTRPLRWDAVRSFPSRSTLVNSAAPRPAGPFICFCRGPSLVPLTVTSHQAPAASSARSIDYSLVPATDAAGVHTDALRRAASVRAL
jgi:hypothetical protein